MSTVTGQCDMIMVPQKPTVGMIKAALAAALAEDASWVWKSMIEAFEDYEDGSIGKSIEESF